MNEERLMQILLAPHISEKGTVIADRHGQVIFKVVTDATKPEVKAAVEKLFEVEVESVQISNMRGKVKRLGSTPGQRKNWKKAYVSLKPGHDIDFVGTQA